MKVIYDIYFNGAYQGYVWAIGPIAAIRDFTGENDPDYRFAAFRTR